MNMFICPPIWLIEVTTLSSFEDIEQQVSKHIGSKDK